MVQDGEQILEGRLPACGNGTLDPGEACDPSIPGVDARCCVNSCGLLRVGAPCAVSEELGLCHESSTCDGGGRCVARPKQSGEICRNPETFGACDIGASCDGEGLECPTAGQGDGCTGEVAQQGKKAAVVTCSAVKLADVPDGDTACEAQGLDGSIGAAVATGASTAGVVVMDPVAKPLRGRKKAENRRRVLKLKLNAAGKRLLKASADGTLTVQVDVSVRNGPRDGDVKRLLQELRLRR